MTATTIQNHNVNNNNKDAIGAWPVAVDRPPPARPGRRPIAAAVRRRPLDRFHLFVFFSPLLDLALPIFTGFYRVLLGFTGFYWVLLGFT